MAPTKDVGVVFRELRERPRSSPEDLAHSVVNDGGLASSALMRGERRQVARFVE
jgi:hypothetical protein